MKPVSIRESSDSDWLLFDNVSKTKYRECPFENYSELPYYRHEIKSNRMLFEFKIETTKTGYSIASFSARPLGEQYKHLKWEPKSKAFEEILPALKRFLTFRFQVEHDGSKPLFKNLVKIQMFAEEQIESIKLYLSGAAHIELLLATQFCEAFGVSNIADVKREAKKLTLANIELPIETETLWYEFDDWIEENQIETFKVELKNLKQSWLTHDAPVDLFFAQLYDRYLSGKAPLPEQDAYVTTHIETLRPYLKKSV
ncbi:MAG: hypothetical protein ABJN69_04185 [Hellea sp.]